MAQITASRVSGILFSFMAAVAMGFITMTSFMVIFPGAGMGWGIAVFFAGCFVETDVYLPGAVYSFKNLFFKWAWLRGLFMSIEYAMTKLAVRQYYQEKGTESLGRLMDFIDHLESHEAFLKALGFEETEISALKKLKATQWVVALLNKLKEKKITAISEEIKANEAEQAILNELLALNKKLSNPEFQRKLYWRKSLAVVALLAALATGLAFGAITFTHVSSAMIALAGLGALSASSPMWVFAVSGLLAGFAAVAYFMMVYRTLAKAIAGDFFQHIKQKLYTTFMPAKPLSTWKEKIFYALNCFFKAIVLIAITALCVIVTMATADAWFNSSERFFSLLGSQAFEVIPAYATYLSYFLVWALYFPITAIFNIESSGNSLEDLWKKLGELPTGLGKFHQALRLRWEHEKSAQFFNPFRLIAAVLESILATSILGAHVGVSGVLPGEGASENGFMSKLPALPATIMGSVVELTVDADYVVGGGHHEHSHTEKNNLQKGFDGHDHDHNHGLTAHIVTAIVFIPKYLGFLWDNAARGVWLWNKAEEYSFKHYRAYQARRPDQYEIVASEDGEVSARASTPGVADKSKTPEITYVSEAKPGEDSSSPSEMSSLVSSC